LVDLFRGKVPLKDMILEIMIMNKNHHRQQQKQPPWIQIIIQKKKIIKKF
jgi:hypothetical protein